MKAEEIEEMLGEVVNALIRHLHAHPEGHNTAEFVTLLHGSVRLLILSPLHNLHLRRG